MLEVDTKPKERQIRKIILLSNNISFGPMPSADAEVEQRLTLYLDGKVFISRYRYDSGEKFKRISTQRKQLQPKQATYLIGQVIGEIIDKRLSIEATDVGSWDLTVFYEDGTRERCQGSLTPDDEGILSSLSDIIREFLESSDLFTFDGQARHDVLERFVFKYHRVTKSTLEAPVSKHSGHNSYVSIGAKMCPWSSKASACLPTAMSWITWLTVWRFEASRRRIGLKKLWR